MLTQQTLSQTLIKVFLFFTEVSSRFYKYCLYLERVAVLRDKEELEESGPK